MVTHVTGINETDSNNGYHLPSKRKQAAAGGKNYHMAYQPLRPIHHLHPVRNLKRDYLSLVLQGLALD
jgi:hypothetical protein